MHALRVTRCTTVIVITFHVACGVQAKECMPTDVAMNLLTMRPVCKARQRSYTINCSVSMKDKGHKIKVSTALDVPVCTVALFSSSVCSDCMYTVLLLPLAHFVISSLTLM